MVKYMAVLLGMMSDVTRCCLLPMLPSLGRQEYLPMFYIQWHSVTLAVTVRSVMGGKQTSCGRTVSGRGLRQLAAEIMGSNPAGGVDAYLLEVLCCHQRSLRRTDHSCREVLQSVAYPSYLEASITRRPWPTRGCCAMGQGGGGGNLLHITSFIHVYYLLCVYEMAVEVFTVIIKAKRNAIFWDSEWKVCALTKQTLYNLSNRFTVSLLYPTTGFLHLCC